MGTPLTPSGPEPLKSKAPEGADGAIDPMLVQAAIMIRGMFADRLKNVSLPENPEWDALKKKHVYAAAIIKAAREKGIDEGYILLYVRDFFAEQVCLKNYDVIADFMENMGMGTPEEIAHFRGFDKKRKAEVAMEVEAILDMEPEDRPHIELTAKSTMADFFHALDAAPALQQIIKENLWDNLGELLSDFSALESNRSEASTITVGDFFTTLDPDDFQDLLMIRWIPTGQRGG